MPLLDAALWLQIVLTFANGADARLMRKLDARSNSDLTYYALKHRLLD